MIGKGLLVILILTTCYGQEPGVRVDPQPPPTSSSSSTPRTTTSTTVTPTTSPPNTTTTTVPTTSTPPPNTTTTAVPTTSTPPPNTTTTAVPTTPTPPPNTTTTAVPTTPTPPPNTTTTAVPTTPTTTTVAPPAPQPEIGKWTVQNKTTNVTCIIADMAVQLNVTHKDSQNKTYVLLDVPKNATATGSCGSSVQVLQLTWPSANKSNKFIVSFEKNDTAKDFSVSFSVTLEILDGKNVTELNLMSIKPEFTTPYEMSYRCMKAQKLNLTVSGSNVTAGYFTVSNTQFEAFHNKSDQTFSAAKDCETTSSPDIVPIAVGCALVGLVAIVLIAYLIGRRRSQARGYLSIDGTDSEERR